MSSLRHQAGRPSGRADGDTLSSPQCWGRRFSLNPHPLFLWDTGAPPPQSPCPLPSSSSLGPLDLSLEEEKAGRLQAVKRELSARFHLFSCLAQTSGTWGVLCRLLVFISCPLLPRLLTKTPHIQGLAWPHACLACPGLPQVDPWPERHSHCQPSGPPSASCCASHLRSLSSLPHLIRTALTPSPPWKSLCTQHTFQWDHFVSVASCSCPEFCT